jgi:hypothetical protein
VPHRSYRVIWESDRLILTPPMPPVVTPESVIGLPVGGLMVLFGALSITSSSGVGAVFLLIGAVGFFSCAKSLLQTESWVLSPGWAESTTGIRFLRSQPLKVSRRPVLSVEVRHGMWDNGKGASDELRINGPGYRSQTVVALDYNLVHNVMRPPARGIGWSVSPNLEGPAADHGTSLGVIEGAEGEAVAPVAPPILKLSRVIAAATGCPATVRVRLRTQPYYGD